MNAILVRFAAARRCLTAVVCALMLLAVLLPGHGVACIPAMQPGQQVATMGAPADNVLPDAMPGHAACQCPCGVAALPAPSLQQRLPLVRPAMFAAAPGPAWRPGAVAPPTEPPRT